VISTGSSAAELEADLPILRLAPFGNIEVGHDLDARDQGAPVCSGHLGICEAGAIDPEPNVHVLLTETWLEMQIGGAQTIGFGDQMTGQPYDEGIVFVNGTSREVGQHRLRRDVFHQLAEQGSHGGPAWLSVKRDEELLDVPAQGDGIADRHPRETPPHVPAPLEIVRIVRQHIEELSPAGDGEPEILL
jgi:hypothetical protein